MVKPVAAVLTMISVVIAVSGCSVTPDEYKDEQPVFDMKTYFNGELQAWGLFQDYRGKVIKRFHVAMTGQWEDDQGTLDERFTYSDGTTQRRIWQLTRIDKHRFTGTADDVIGEATGQAFGNALRWKYVLALPVDDDVYHVTLDDWMWLIDANTVINHSVMSKFGVTVGNVILVFRKNTALNAPRNKAPEMEINRNFNMPEVQRVAARGAAVI
jgi:hypothetical protein